MSVSGKRVALFALTVLFLAAALTPLISNKNVSAAQITNRSLTLESGTVGGSAPGDGNAAHTVKHLFTFTLPSSASVAVGSIQFQYCTTSAGTCTMPLGLVTTAATLSGQTGLTGFTLNNTTNGAPYITRTAATGSGTGLTYELSSVQNPTATNTSFFVRITSFTSTTATTGATDTGVVTASTATAIVLSGIMPESIIFCTGVTITAVSGIPDCSTAGTGAISFNQLFSPSDTAIAESQMSASTNAASGYAITVNGATLTSGSNTITAMTTAGGSVKSSPQFGLNLRANTSAAASSFPGTTSPYISADVTAASNGTTLKGNPAAGYDTADSFKFDPAGDVVARSDNGGAGPTDGQIYTASYIVNVPGRQPAGTYTTTLTYTCTATF
jgi:hypothetical protein